MVRRGHFVVCFLGVTVNLSLLKMWCCVITAKVCFSSNEHMRCHYKAMTKEVVLTSRFSPPKMTHSQWSVNDWLFVLRKKYLFNTSCSYRTRKTLSDAEKMATASTHLERWRNVIVVFYTDGFAGREQIAAIESCVGRRRRALRTAFQQRGIQLLCVHICIRYDFRKESTLAWLDLPSVQAWGLWSDRLLRNAANLFGVKKLKPHGLECSFKHTGNLRL